MGLLTGKVAAVTGGGGGLGQAFATALAAEGAAVVVNDLGVERDGSGKPDPRRADRVVELIRKAGGQALASYETVATPDGARRIVQAAVDGFGRLDILVNSAGIIERRPLLEIEPATWDRLIATHLSGTFHCLQAAARVMIDQGEGGRIINNSSLVGFQGNFHQAAYGAAKAGVAGLTMTAALELSRYQITVNCIVPVAYTRLTRDEPMFQEEGIAARFRPEDAAPLVVFLASGLSESVTGRLIGVQGKRIFAYSMAAGTGVTARVPWDPRMILDQLKELLKV